MFAHRLHVLVSLMLVIAILMPEMEYAQSDVFQYQQKGQAANERHQYCGRSLSAALQLVCGGRYNSRFKKSNQEMEMNDHAFTYDVYPYKSIENAWKMLRFRRYSRGVHEECCQKPCSKEELHSYCAHS